MNMARGTLHAWAWMLLLLLLLLETLAETACPPCKVRHGLARCTDVWGFPVRRLSQCLPELTTKLNLQGAGLGPLGAGAFPGLGALLGLELSDNAVALIHEDALRGLSRLTSFSCRNCSLEALAAGTFARTPGLVTLDLSWNHLRALPRGLLEPLGALHELRLLRNHLRVLSPSWLRHSHGLVLRAEGNKWHCDCQAYYMMMALASAGVDHDVALDVCESPIHYRGALLKALVKGTCA